jgi:hypothetical protein
LGWTTWLGSLPKNKQSLEGACYTPEDIKNQRVFRQ